MPVFQYFYDDEPQDNYTREQYEDDNSDYLIDLEKDFEDEDKE